MITLNKLKEIFINNIVNEKPNGFIEISPAVIDYWITTITIPTIGTIRCNKLVASDLFKIFYEIPKNLIDVNDTIRSGGCYVPRYMYCQIHKKYDKCKGLSMHALGLAIDINPSTNGFGTKGTTQNKTIAEIFKKYNWSWGGDWKIPDPMHYEFRNF